MIYFVTIKNASYSPSLFHFLFIFNDRTITLSYWLFLMLIFQDNFNFNIYDIEY